MGNFTDYIKRLFGHTKEKRKHEQSKESYFRTNEAVTARVSGGYPTDADVSTAQGEISDIEADQERIISKDVLDLEEKEKAKQEPSFIDASHTELLATKRRPFYQRFDIDLAQYGDMAIGNVPMSQRFSNMLLRNGITTISKFLELSEEDIASIKNNGEITVREALVLAQRLAKTKPSIQEEGLISMEEVQEVRYCDRFNSELYDNRSLDDVNMPNRLRSRLTLQGCKTVGQFLRLTPREIKEIPGAGTGTVQAAEQVIYQILNSEGSTIETSAPSEDGADSLSDITEIRYCDRF